MLDVVNGREPPEVRIVVDPFDLVRGANSALVSVRHVRQRFVRRQRRTGGRQTRAPAGEASFSTPATAS